MSELPASTRLPSERDWLREDEVNNDRLIELCADKGIHAEIEEEPYLFLGLGLDYPSWLLIDTDRKVISLLNYVSLIGGERTQQDRVINSLNRAYLGLQFYRSHGGLLACHCLPYEGGFFIPHLFVTLRRFTRGFRQAIHEPFVRPLVGAPLQIQIH